MGEDEEGTVRTITAYREVLSTLIRQHNGNVLDSPGDNLLAEFVSVVDAVQCGVAVQKEIKARNDELPENRRMQFRIGINLGDVIQEKDRIYGDGVNVAARLEGLADPGGPKHKGTQNLQAYLKLLEALSAFYKFTRDGNARARQLAEEAIAIDPEYARAYATLSYIHQVDIAMGLGKSRRESEEKATRYAKKAQSLDEKDFVGYTALVGHYLGKRDYENAVKEAQKAINLAPRGSRALR